MHNLNSLPALPNHSKIEDVLHEMKGRFYPFPDDMSGNFAMRNSTDFRDAKIFAEVSTGERSVIAEMPCNQSADKALNILTNHFEPLRAFLADKKSQEREGRTHLNSYERRQEERRDRYEDIALAKRRASNAAFDASHNAVAHIPFGQPILVGHHSEKRHRAVIARSHNAMELGCTLAKTADYYERRAESVGNSGISSDDPDAIIKLTEKVNSLKKAHKMMIEANKIIRLKDVSEEIKEEKLFCLGYSEQMVKEIMRPQFGGQGFASYQLSLSNKAIKTAEGRISSLSKAKEQSSDVIEYTGFSVKYDTEDNRIVIMFDGKPEEDVRKLLKRNAFKFSPSRKGAWVRMITPNAMHATKYMLEKLKEFF